MTVCTNYVARGDLAEYGLPVAIAQAYRDIEVLGPKMVELEDERVGLTAVNARSLAEELDEIGGALCDERLFSANCVRDVSLAVRCIMLLFVGGSAGSAVVVPLPTCLTSPGEARDRHELPAAAAQSELVRHLACHEHMFAHVPDGRIRELVP
jgi:hypothetical protein